MPPCVWVQSGTCNPRTSRGTWLQGRGLYSAVMPPRLGVNIDHVATVRQARRAPEPDPVHAAVLAELGGADGITVHLRDDRRHIQDRDVEILRQVVKTRLNLEMAATQEMVRIALTVKPDPGDAGAGAARGADHRGRPGRAC